MFQNKTPSLNFIIRYRWLALMALLFSVTSVAKPDIKLRVITSNSKAIWPEGIFTHYSMANTNAVVERVL